MVNPFFILAPLLMKKTFFLTAAQAYGYPRIYRRLLEANKKLIADKQQRVYIRGVLRQGMIAPMTISQHLDNKDLVAFISKLSAYVLKEASTSSPAASSSASSSPPMPEFIRDFAKIVNDAVAKLKK